MARFAGKERNAGGQVANGLLAIIGVIVLVLIILALWQPLWAEPILAPLRLWHPYLPAFGS